MRRALYERAGEAPAVARRARMPWTDGMVQRPTVSVVIPVKDDAELLDRCLAALALQTVRPHEIVVVDNASSDLTAAVAARPGIRRLPNDEPGIPATASAGYDAATGEIIARLDADSVPPADWIERIADAFAADAELEALTGPGDFPELRGAARRIVDVTYMEAYFVLMGALMGHPPIFGSNAAIRSTAWARVSGTVHRHDARVHDDLDLSFCLGRRSRVRLDRSLRVPVSSRPFTGVGSMLKRVWRGIYTVAVNVPPGRRSRARSAPRSTAPAAPARRADRPASSPPR